MTNKKQNRLSDEEIQKRVHSIDPKVTYISGYEIYRSKCKFLHADFPNEPFEGLFISFMKGRLKHPRLSRNKTVDDSIIQQRISKHNPDLIYVSGYENAKSTCTFIHKDFPDEPFQARYVSALHPMIFKSKHFRTAEELNAKLKRNLPYLTYISGYKDYESMCVFLDKDFGEFSGVWRQVLKNDYKHPKRREYGLIKHFYQNKPLREFAKNLKKSEAHITRVFNKYGEEGLKRLEETPSKTHIEQKIEVFLTDRNIDYLFNNHFLHKRENPKPDFILPVYNLILECDGLYYHSEGNHFRPLPKNYHSSRRKFFNNNNYSLLAFYEDEIHSKFEIIKSMVLNKINLSTRIFARKCQIQPLTNQESKSFLDYNHLKGGCNYAFF